MASAGSSADARCSCGAERSAKDERRCRLGHQWRAEGLGLNRSVATEGPDHQTPLEQDERLTNYSSLYQHQRTVVRIERFIDRLDRRLHSAHLAPKTRDTTEQRIIQAEGLLAAAKADVERLDRSHAEAEKESRSYGWRGHPVGSK
jgi:hypothetical protein